MGIIGFVCSTVARVADQPIYITCPTRKFSLSACALRSSEDAVEGAVRFGLWFQQQEIFGQRQLLATS